MRSWRTLIRLLALPALSAWGGAALAQDRDNCLYCHQYPGLSRLDSESSRVRLFYIDPGYVHNLRGPHARLACTDCHNREEVGVVPHLASTPVDCTRQCHLASSTAPERRFSHENIARMLEQSAHAQGVLKSLEYSGGPLLSPSQSVCLYCHDEPVFRDVAAHARLESTDNALDRCDVCHRTQIPLDTPYFLLHVSSRLLTARPSLEVAQVCATCHSDPAVLRPRGIPDAVASYVRSYHGKAALLGDITTANCVSCHIRAGENAHLMRGPKDPLSAVHPAHVANSCRTTTCHPGAEKTLAENAVHLDLPSARGTIDFALAVAFILLTIVSFGPSAVIVLLELAQLVIGRHHHASRRVANLAEKILARPDGAALLQRFNLPQRIQHWLLTALFVLLCLTGFPMKFADQAWAGATIRMFGGLATARVLHHWAGIALVIGFGLHLLHIALGVTRRAIVLHLNGDSRGWLNAVLSLPIALTPNDLRQAGYLLGYLVGMRRERPLFGRFTVNEKFEYFGVLWGTTLLGVTGLMLWGEQISSHFLSGRAFNLATIIHTYEAFLAVIHVGILHIYNVVLNPAVFPLSLATLTGQTPVTKLAEEHGQYVLDTAAALGLEVAEADDA